MIRLRGLDRDTSERGSALLMTIIFSVLAGGLMLVLLSVLLSQAQASGLAQKNTRTGYAAQAGIQATLSVLRSSTVSINGTTYGDPSRLPNTLSGTVDGLPDSDLGYDVTIAYYSTDPSGQSDSWLAANALPYPLSSATGQQPKYARIVASGTDAAITGLGGDVADRTVSALYTFTTTNVNIPGGLIKSADSTGCLKAVSPSVGSLIKMVPLSECTDDTRDMWVYDTDYRIKLANTVGTADVLCITGQQWAATPTGITSSTANATLQLCAAENSSAPGNQLWSWDFPDSWEGQDKTNSIRSNRWLSMNGDTLVDGRTKVKSFDPAPAVGAGAASAATQQLVNYREFGRCLDVALNAISSGYLIAYPCKQDPTGTGAAVNWNHKWTYTEPTGTATSTAPQAIWVKENEVRPYCLTARMGSDPRVHATSCATPNNTTSLSALQQFIRNGDTGDNRTSYTIQFAGDPTLCLTAVSTPSTSGDSYSVIQLLSCNGSTAQKWNAPAQTMGSSLGGYKEIG
ncbi:hypothetical protein [Microbacterium sp. GXF6406]